MAKRKPAVNDIIYELDNDSELSSEEEVKQPKICRIEGNSTPNSTQSDSNTQSSCLEVIDIDSSTDKIDVTLSPKAIRNGGKSPNEFIIVDEVSGSTSPNTSISKLDNKKLSSDTIFNEDVVVDSPASSSDPGVVGCENKTPLITVKFRDSKIAMNYKKKIKEFLINLIKLPDDSIDSDDETDLELDIWSEDLGEGDPETEDSAADNLFFIDTDPVGDMPVSIPSYSQNTEIMSNTVEKEQSPPATARWKGPTCFNCNGQHTMRECREPRNNARINENRKAMMKKGRYHVEDEQKYGHLVPGRISAALRTAMGLERHELPLYIYRMRQLGYPPGWLEEARISHSGITLFDSSGQATLDPEDEEGELCEPGSKDKYDIKKILDFPGFNVPASSRYKEEAHLLGLPPMSSADSKLAMLAVLAPNAMKAYKRKKLTLFPTAPGDHSVTGTAEMEIDSGDELVDFPSQPPLPDDAPPPPPPPPAVPPPPDSPPPLPFSPPPEKKPNKPSKDRSNFEPSNKLSPIEKSKKTLKKSAPNSKNNSQSILKTDSDDDLEVVEVLKVADIPVPMADMITIDVDGEVSEPESGQASPSLDDLEAKKRILLDALGTESAKSDVESNETYHKDADTDGTAITDVDTRDGSQTAEIANDMDTDVKLEEPNPLAEEEVEKDPDIVQDKVNTESEYKALEVENNDNAADEKTNVENVDKTDAAEEGELPSEEQTENKVDEGSSEKAETESKNQLDVETDSSSQKEVVSTSSNKSAVESTISTPTNIKETSTDAEVPKTPTSSMGQVRETTYGTPVINVASPYLKLPSDDKFAKDICDVINFENLPNSVGKYKKISTLLKKVKSEVDRIQES